MFKGILLNKNEDGTTRAELTQIDEATLPADGDVTIAVEYSTINYKDGLAITGKSPVVRKWPMVPGMPPPATPTWSAHWPSPAPGRRDSSRPGSSSRW
jgi:acrylyl-CoA reductase (NADPH)